MSLKIRLARGGAKKRPFYAIVVADARSPRDGRFIERLGTYNPMLERGAADRVTLKEERVRHWLGVGAQPTDQVLALLKVTGDWQKFKGLPGAEGTLKVKAGKVDPKAAVEAAAADAEKVKATVSAKKAEEPVAAAEEPAADEAPAEDEQA